MEWVETTGRTVADAKEAALDQLGVDEQEAEFEILAEPRQMLFGLVRREARVRARVRPSRPRPKVDRRDRRRRQTRDNRDGRRDRNGDAPAVSDKTTATKAADGKGAADRSAPASGSTSTASSARRRRGRRSGSGQRTAAAASTAEGPSAAVAVEQGSSEATTTRGDSVTVDEQGEITKRFLTGLVEAFGLAGSVHAEKLDEETVEVRVIGDDLGLMIGPKGATLQAIQDLARTTVQHEADGDHEGRVRIDIGGYRQRRREALERFTRQVAEDVRTSGVQRALEPMNPADRKVVHDTANDIPGVKTTSEGQEPHRRVVILPEE
jgi:spoIIIJ-associated protein